MLGEQDDLRVRVVAHGLADPPGEGEARPYVGDPDRLVAEALGRELLAAFRAADHVDSVRVRVVHVRVGHEGVQERLYGAPRHIWPELAAREVGDHLLVAHLLALLERQNFVELETGELLGPYGREVAP